MNIVMNGFFLGERVSAIKRQSNSRNDLINVILEIKHNNKNYCYHSEIVEY